MSSSYPVSRHRRCLTGSHNDKPSVGICRTYHPTGIEAAGGARAEAAVYPSFPATRRHGGAAAARRERAGRERWRGTERGESGGKAQSGGRELDFIKRAGRRAPKLAHAQPLFPARTRSFPDIPAISTLFSTVIFISYLIFISTSFTVYFFSLYFFLAI